MLPAEFDLSGRVAVITGGSMGIGKAIALLFAKRGSDLVIAARGQDALEATAAEIRETIGRRCIAVAADVCVPDQAQTVIDKAIAEYGRLDILINNAGKSSFSSYAKMPPEMWDKDVTLNLSSAFYCAQAAYPHLKANGNGAIVNISSLAGIHGTVGCGAYSAAKAGLQMFTRVSSAEWGPKGVRVNAVAPGMIVTEGTWARWEADGFDAMAACQGFPLRRPGTAEEVAQAVAFLASDAASYITGEVLAVGGGPQIKGLIDVDD